MTLQPYVLQTTTSSHKNALLLAKKILENHLAACVQLDQIDSLFHWQGEIKREGEFRLVIKTARECFADIAALIKQHHIYDCPEIIATPIVEISADYGDWLERSLKINS